MSQPSPIAFPGDLTPSSNFCRHQGTHMACIDTCTKTFKYMVHIDTCMQAFIYMVHIDTCMKTFTHKIKEIILKNSQEYF